MQYANGDGANNGYLCFGNGTVESQLVKCGLRDKQLKSESHVRAEAFEKERPYLRSLVSSVACVPDRSRTLWIPSVKLKVFKAFRPP